MALIPAPIVRAADPRSGDFGLLPWRAPGSGEGCPPSEGALVGQMSAILLAAWPSLSAWYQAQVVDQLRCLRFPNNGAMIPQMGLECNRQDAPPSLLQRRDTGPIRQFRVPDASSSVENTPARHHLAAQDVSGTVPGKMERNSHVDGKVGAQSLCYTRPLFPALTRSSSIRPSTAGSDRSMASCSLS
jgi:hypothetical protein